MAHSSNRLILWIIGGMMMLGISVTSSCGRHKSAQDRRALLDSLRIADSLERAKARALVQAQLDSMRISDSLASIKPDFLKAVEEATALTYAVSQKVTDNSGDDIDAGGVYDGTCSVSIRKDGIATLAITMRNSLSINGSWTYDGSIITIHIGAGMMKGAFNDDFSVLTIDNSVVGAYGWNGSTILQLKR